MLQKGCGNQLTCSQHLPAQESTIINPDHREDPPRGRGKNDKGEIPYQPLEVDIDKEPIPSFGNVFIDGRDFTQGPPYNTASAVSLWKQQLAHGGNEVVCQLDHGTEVEIIRKENCSKVRDTFFYVQSEDCKGWVVEISLSTQYEKVETQAEN